MKLPFGAPAKSATLNAIFAFVSELNVFTLLNTFSGGALIDTLLKLGTQTNVQTGSDVVISWSHPITNLTGNITTIGGIATPADGTIVALINAGTFTYTVVDEDSSVGTAANRIRTGTGKPITFLPNASIFLQYSGTTSRWHVIGGTGGGGGSYIPTAVQSITAGGTVTTSNSDGFQMRRVQGSAAAVSTAAAPFGTALGWSDGMVITLIGQHDTNTVTIADSRGTTDGVFLNGDAVLGLNSVLSLIYDATASLWIQKERANC